ncbi:MAG: fimbrillin family protein [Bacteroidales bacterium]|nr:fimbrillin family protein [Candidatus Cacconaster merdequi]
MHRVLSIIVLAASVVAAVSCGGKDTAATEQPLRISVKSIDGTKAVITNDGFPESSAAAMGLFLKASDGNSDYDGHTAGYSNVKAEKAAASSTWEINPSIMLSETKGTLFAYYPYSSSATDFEQVPVVSSINGADYLYSVPFTGLNASTNAATLNLKHALALVSINFIRNSSYSGPGKLSYLSLSSDAIAPTGRMDIRDGSLTASSSPIVFSGFEETIGESGLTEYLLVVPALYSTEKRDVELTCVIDGVQYNLSMTGKGADGNGVIIRQGVHSKINLTLKDKDLQVGNVAVEAWNTASGSGSSIGFGGTGIYPVDVNPAEYGGSFDI